MEPVTLPPTSFAWRVLDMGDYPAKCYGQDDRCWLCGGPTEGVGWQMADAIPPTYTNHTLAKCPTSRTICQPCAAMGSKDTWERYAAAHPEMGLKTGHAMSWRCYSHLFAWPHHHECPNRARWRDILLSPPEPPFLAVIAQSGQKHLIFRGAIAHDRDLFPVQFEERQILVQRQGFAGVLADFERLYNLGFSKDSILTGGPYHAGQLLKVGLARWRPAEEAMRVHRRLRPSLVALAHFVAQRDPEFAIPDAGQQREEADTADIGLAGEAMPVAALPDGQLSLL